MTTTPRACCSATATGHFRLKHSFATGIGANSVAVGDFNGDGNRDMVTAAYIDNAASMLLGNGNGTFQARA